MKRRTTVYVEEPLYIVYTIYKQQVDTTITFSQFVNKVLKDYLTNPFNWENENLFNFAMNREGL